MKIKDIVIGRQYNNIIILGPKKRENGYTYFGCKCAICGKEYWIQDKHIGRAKSCRECSEVAQIKDLSGRRFGRLVAVEYVGRKNDRSLWKCLCDCGNESVVGYSNLINGTTRSCGCLEKENLEYIQKHSSRRKSASPEFAESLSTHPLYSTWSSMLTRCYNKSRKCYKYYGERGIGVCDRWLPENEGFEHFVQDMGPKPSPEYTIDRINNDDIYCPENCRWADQRTQNNNKRNNWILFYNGRRVSATEVSIAVGIKYRTLIQQLKNGFDINIIIENNGADFRRSKYKKNLDSVKNGNRNISIFVPTLDRHVSGREKENTPQ